MASEWKEYRLGQILDIKNGKSRPKREGQYPVYGGNGILGFADQYNIEGETIIIGRVGAYCGAVYYENNKCWISDNALYGRTKNNYVKFLYYLLKNKNLNQFAGGSSHPLLTQSGLNELIIDIPDLPTQREIASILSALDDKIELIRQTNETLEEMTKAIFKEWFVNFNYPGATGKMQQSELGEIPEGWKVVAIGELFDFVIGGDWGKEVASEEFPEECYVIRGTDFSSIMEGNIGKVPKRFIKTSNFIKRKLQPGDILLEISGGSTNQATGRNLLITEDLVSLFDHPVVPASFCRLIRPESLPLSTFLAIYLKDLYDRGGTWDYQLQSTGISNFQFQFFAEKEVLALPAYDILEQFEELMNPIIKMRGSAINEIQQLTFTRDSLLPKLMAGEIEV